MKIWITTDTHFGHDKMVQYCGRPKDFEMQILKGFNVLNENDILIHLGDICIGNDSIFNGHFKMMKCKKILTKGNHDNKSNNWYLNNGWDFVCESFCDKLFGKNMIFSHMPIPVSGETINIHGHFHNALPRLLKGEWKVDGEKERNEQDLLNYTTGNHKLIALEYTNYKPVNLQNLINKTI